MFYEKIIFDENFFFVNMMPKLIKFHFMALLPEIIMRNYQKKKEIIDLRIGVDESILANYK